MSPNKLITDLAVRQHHKFAEMSLLLSFGLVPESSMIFSCLALMLEVRFLLNKSFFERFIQLRSKLK